MERTVSLMHSEVTEQVIGAFYEVYRELGFGFVEAVYRRALVVAIQERGLSCATEVPYALHLYGRNIGDYRADIVVADRVILEVKTAPLIPRVHTAQLLNYLRASNLQVGLILNFGPSANFRRHILSPVRTPAADSAFSQNSAVSAHSAVSAKSPPSS